MLLLQFNNNLFDFNSLYVLSSFAHSLVWCTVYGRMCEWARTCVCVSINYMFHVDLHISKCYWLVTHVYHPNLPCVDHSNCNNRYYEILINIFLLRSSRHVFFSLSLVCMMKTTSICSHVDAFVVLIFSHFFFHFDFDAFPFSTICSFFSFFFLQLHIFWPMRNCIFVCFARYRLFV